MNGFKTFLLRGNLVDMAVGIVIGVAFGAVVTAFVKDLITPIIAALFGKPHLGRVRRMFQVDDAVARVAIQAECRERPGLWIYAGGVAARAAAGEFILLPFTLLV